MGNNADSAGGVGLAIRVFAHGRNSESGARRCSIGAPSRGPRGERPKVFDRSRQSARWRNPAEAGRGSATHQPPGFRTESAPGALTGVAGRPGVGHRPRPFARVSISRALCWAVLTRSPSPARAATVAPCLWWLCYGAKTGRVDRVVIVGAWTLIGARMRAGIAGLDAGAVFVEGHYLDALIASRVPADVIGRRLTPKRASALLAVLDGKAARRSK